MIGSMGKPGSARVEEPADLGKGLARGDGHGGRARGRERDQVFIGKTNGSSCRKSRASL
jgi:hypothetical protein